MIEAARGEPVDERPLFFRAARETLVGVLSLPAEEGMGLGVLLAPGGGTPSTAIERNGVFVALARTLALRGHHVFRFDYHGVGDSTGQIAGFRLDQPFVADMDAATAVLRASGIERLVIVGSCFGARTAMAAHTEIEGVEGIVLLAPPCRDFALSERTTEGWSIGDYLLTVVRPRRLVGGTDRVTIRRYLRFLRSGARVVLRRLRSRFLGEPGDIAWVSRHFLGGLSSIVDHRIPVLLLYGTDDDEYRDFEDARTGRLGTILNRAGDLIEIVVVRGPVHGFTRVDAQVTVVRLVSDWVGWVVGSSGAGSARS